MTTSHNAFWYAIGSGWLEFLASETRIQWDRCCRAVYFVDVGRSNILRIKTKNDMVAFTKKWGNQRRGPSFDWIGLAKKYDGIEITPFEYIFGWDCASGCVWNLGNVSLSPADDATISELRRRAIDRKIA